MKIALAQINTRVGDIDYNFDKIVKYIKSAKRRKADIIIFPELTITGYPPKDLLYDQSFVEYSIKKIYELVEYSKGICIVIGGVRKSNNLYGKAKLFNTAYVIHDLEIGYQDKTLLPNYAVFDERRYFLSADSYRVFNIKGLKFAVTICEDIWKENYYNVSSIPFYGNLDFMVNISSSPFSITKDEQRMDVLFNRYKEYNCPIFYVNQVGGQDDLIFDGSSVAYDKNGYIQICESFEETLKIVNLNHLRSSIKKQSEEEKVFNALVLGTRDYFYKTGFKQAVIGLSGGVDSSIDAVIASKALGKENVLGILMPSKFSSESSISDALGLVNNIGIDHRIIPISEIHQVTNRIVSRGFLGDNNSKLKSITDQNLQARLRTNTLMMMSNETGALLICNSNKSENCLGYVSLGDSIGGLNIIGDVYKTTVFKVSNFINRNGIIIPKNVLIKAPSAELKKGHKDSDDLPDYAILDKILKLYIEKGKSKEYIINHYDRPIGDFNLVNDIVRRVNINEFKRRQSPAMIIVSDRDLINSRRMPIVNGWL